MNSPLENIWVTPPHQQSFSREGAKVWKQNNEITYIQVDDKKILGSSEILDILCTVYQLNQGQTKIRLLMQTSNLYFLSQDAELFLARSQPIVAVAVVSKAPWWSRWYHRLGDALKRNYPWKTFSSLESGVHWLERF